MDYNINENNDENEEIPLKKKNDQKITVILIVSTIAFFLSAIQFGHGLGEMNSAEVFVPVYIDNIHNFSNILINEHNKTCNHMKSWFSDCLILIKQFKKTILDQWYYLQSIFPIGGLIGGPLSNWCSRKYTIWFFAFIFLVSYSFKSCFTNFWIMLLGRFLTGVASGVSSGVVSMYIGEIAPTKYRGAFGVLSQLGINTGVTLAQTIGIFTFQGQLWRVLFSWLSVLSLLQIVIIPFLPFSPRWLLGKKKSEKAEMHLRLIRGTTDVEKEIKEMSSGLFGEKEKIKMTRWRLIKHFMIGIGLQIIQQFCGVTAIAFYSTNVFYDAHVLLPPEIITALCGLVRLLAVFSAIFMIDRFGRKPLLLIGLSGQFFFLVLLTVSLTINQHIPNPISTTIFGIISIISVFLFCIFFGIGIGPIPWFIFTEIFPTDIRPIAAAICTFINWFSMFLVGLFFMLIKSYLQTFSFVPFAIVVLIGVVYIYFLFDETKGKSMEEICYGNKIMENNKTLYDEEE